MSNPTIDEDREPDAAELLDAATSARILAEHWNDDLSLADNIETVRWWLHRGIADGDRADTNS